MILKGNIYFNSEEIPFELESENKIRKWIEKTIENEGKKTGEISYIFCSDEYLYQLNLKHLKHTTFTDIITFNYCEDNLINTDIFISIDRVKENAKVFCAAFETELKRVMIHGILHLVGYDDKTDNDKVLMRSKEDFYLNFI